MYRNHIKESPQNLTARIKTVTKKCSLTVVHAKSNFIMKTNVFSPTQLKTMLRVPVASFRTCPLARLFVPHYRARASRLKNLLEFGSVRQPDTFSHLGVFCYSIEQPPLVWLEKSQFLYHMKTV